MLRVLSIKRAFHNWLNPVLGSVMKGLQRKRAIRCLSRAEVLGVSALAERFDPALGADAGVRAQLRFFYSEGSRARISERGSAGPGSVRARGNYFLAF